MTMKYFFYLVSKEDKKNAHSIGKVCTYKNRAKWIEIPSDISNYLASVNFTQGINSIVYDNKVYMIWKSYIDISENFVVFVCIESTQGADIEIET